MGLQYVCIACAYLHTLIMLSHISLGLYHILIMVYKIDSFSCVALFRKHNAVKLILSIVFTIQSYKLVPAYKTTAERYPYCLFECVYLNEKFVPGTQYLGYSNSAQDYETNLH